MAEKTLMRGFLKPAAVLLILVAFFIFYNAYLVDNSLELLNISLDETAHAQSPIHLETASLLLENAAIREAGRSELNLRSVTALNFASSVADDAQTLAQLKGSRFAIRQAIADQESRRFFLLRWIDWLNREIQGVIRFLRKTLNDLIRGTLERPRAILRYDMLTEARKLERSGRLEEAKAQYENFIKLNRGAEGIGIVQTRLAFLEMKLGKYEEARVMLDEVQRSVSLTEARVAQNLKSQVDRLEKLAVQREGLKTEIAAAREPSALQQLYYDLGKMSVELYDLPAAETAFKKAIDLNPVSVVADQARFSMGFAYKLADNLVRSEEIFASLAKTALSDNLKAASSLQLAHLKQSAGDFAGAAELMERTARIAPDAATAVLSAFEAGYVYLFNMNDTHKSYKALQEAKHLADERRVISVDPRDIGTLPLREYAYALFEAGRLKEAKDAFQTVLKVDENDAWSYAGLGMIYEIEGKRKRAASLIEKGYRLRMDYFTTAVMAYFEERQGHLETSELLNKRAIKLNADYLYPYYNLGHVYLTQKRYQDALDILKKGRDLAVKLGRKAPLLKSNLGYCYFQLGQLNEAVRAFDGAIKDDEETVDAWYNRALVHEQLGNRAAYRRDLEKAFSLRPDFKDVKERIASPSP